MARRTNEQIIADLIEEGANLLSEAYTLGQALTEAYRRLAGVIVDLRKRFPNSKDTGPDWRGSTQAYRDAVATMYEQSGVPTDSASNMQAAIRYHIGNVLRERLTPEELTEAGLSVEGPLDRSRAAREAADEEEVDEEWFEDVVETLKSVEDEHPDVLIVDLREDHESDSLALTRKVLAVLQTARHIGVTPANQPAVTAVLDQVLAEAASFRTEAMAVEPAPKRGRPKKVPA